MARLLEASFVYYHRDRGPHADENEHWLPPPRSGWPSTRGAETWFWSRALEKVLVVTRQGRGLSVWDQAAREADWTLELPGGVPMFFRRIPAGSFHMGSRGHDATEEPRHLVVIPEDFYLGSFVVTQEQYRAIAERTPALEKAPDPSTFKGPRRPIENVSWRDAVAFCDRLRHEVEVELPEGFAQVCLPTEAEWEYACRAGSDEEYYSGDGERALAEVAWFSENSGDESHPVDERIEGHPYGLHGMHGNVWEWCHDVRDDAAYRKRVDGEADPGGPLRRAEWQAGLDAMTASNLGRVLRGGSWDGGAGDCRSAYRLGIQPVVRDDDFGFRVCLVRGVAEPKEEKRGRRRTGPRKPQAEGRGWRWGAPGSRCAGARSISSRRVNAKDALAQR
jgi:formylglycine-generating enzyme required for sulfatase activity